MKFYEGVTPADSQDVPGLKSSIFTTFPKHYFLNNLFTLQVNCLGKENTASQLPENRQQDALYS